MAGQSNRSSVTAKVEFEKSEDEVYVWTDPDGVTHVIVRNPN